MRRTEATKAAKATGATKAAPKATKAAKPAPAGKARGDVQIALLRGINVGRAKRIAMADLRSLCEGLGYGNVRTLLNSGNVVFTSPRSSPAESAAKIEKALTAKVGVSARVTVIDAAELAEMVEKNPFLDIADDPSRLLVAVLNDQKDRALLDPLLEQAWSPDAISVGNRAAYVWCAGGILESKLATALGRALRDGVTSRNWATMLKLHALAGETAR